MEVLNMAKEKLKKFIRIMQKVDKLGYNDERIERIRSTLLGGSINPSLISRH